MLKVPDRINLYDLSSRMGAIGQPSVQLRLPYVATHTSAHNKVLVVSSRYFNTIQCYSLSAVWRETRLKYTLFIGKNVQVCMCRATTDEEMLLAVLSKDKHKCLITFAFNRTTLSCVVRLIASDFQAFVPTTDRDSFCYIDEEKEIYGISLVSKHSVNYGKCSGRGTPAVAVSFITKAPTDTDIV